MDTLTIYVVEADNAESFKIYDQSDWAAFSNANVTLVNISVTYNSVTYTDKLYDSGDATNKLGLDGTYANLFGVSSNSFYSVQPSQLEFGGASLSSTHFSDGYYEILLSVTYSGVAKTDSTMQGFLSESYLMACQLPLSINLDNFNYNENRVQFLCIALFNSAKWAGELGRETSLVRISEKINEVLDARDINSIWSV